MKYLHKESEHLSIESEFFIKSHFRLHFQDYLPLIKKNKIIFVRILDKIN